MYIPSDFFSTNFRWVDAFPPHMPFTLNKPCSFHVMHKDVDPCNENTAVLEPSDADYLFSAKVCQEIVSWSSLYDEIQEILYKRADICSAIETGIQTHTHIKIISCIEYFSIIFRSCSYPCPPWKRYTKDVVVFPKTEIPIVITFILHAL